MPSVLDWQLHGVTLKVELATSGQLTIGNTQTDFPFTPGGEYGGPVGWDAGHYYAGGNAGQEGFYNYTTSGGIFSVSPKVPDVYSAGVWLIQSFPMVAGFRYQLGVQVRQMAGHANGNKSATMQSSTNNGTSWLYYTGIDETAAQSDWEQILATGNVVSTNRIGRIYLLGGPPNHMTAADYGAQFQNLFVRQLDKTTPPIVWEDVTCDVKSIGVRYGRERFTNRYDVSTMQLDLANSQGKYSFHQPHPLGLQPGRPVRVTATYKGVVYPVAYHIIDSMVDAYGMDGSVIARWSCVDPTSILSRTPTASNPQWPDGAADRIGLLLDQVGYLPRLLDPDVWDEQAIIANGRSIRDECGVSSDSEGGNFFADRLGNCVYKNRNWPTTDPNLYQVTADLVASTHPGGVMPIVDQVPTQATAPLIDTNEMQTDWSQDRLINNVSLANAGGVAQEFVDAESMKQYGPNTYTRHDFVLWSDYYLAQRADDIMSGYSEPVLRVNRVGYSPGVNGAWEFTLGVFLNWLVRVWYSHPTNYWGYAFCVHIQSIEHRITPDNWATVFTVDLPESFTELEWLFENGWDQQDWDDSLWDQGDETMGALWDSGNEWH